MSLLLFFLALRTWVNLFLLLSFLFIIRIHFLVLKCTVFIKRLDILGWTVPLCRSQVYSNNSSGLTSAPIDKIWLKHQFWVRIDYWCAYTNILSVLLQESQHLFHSSPCRFRIGGFFWSCFRLFWLCWVALWRDRYSTTVFTQQWFSWNLSSNTGCVW